MKLPYTNRRKLPVVNIILSISFMVSLVLIVFWTASIDSRLTTVSTMQKSVLGSNLKFSIECKSIKEEMEKMKNKLTDIHTILLQRNND